MKKNIYFIICVLVLSCTDSSKNKKAIIVDKIESVSKDTIVRRVLSSRDNFGGPNFVNHDNVGELDTLFVKKIIYPKKTLFIYSSYNPGPGHRPDTLTIYKDSAYVYSSIRLDMLRQKTFSLGKSKLNITKFKYGPRGLGFPADLYVNDSVGIVIHQVRATWYAVVEYNVNLHELHKSIIRDSTFFEFEFPM